MRDSEQQAIRRALAERLEGMREECGTIQIGTYLGWHMNPASTVAVHNPLPSKFNGESTCPGYLPVPTTAEGLTDVGRLIRAIESRGFRVTRAETDGKYTWGVYGDGYGQFDYDPDLGVAYLKAVGAWPLKEEAHD